MANTYESAVKGRRDFRLAYRREREAKRQALDAVALFAKALIQIQSFDGGYQRAWEIAENAFKAAGYQDGIEAREAFAQPWRPALSTEAE